MHELAIAQSIVEVVDESATAHHAARVQSVSLRIGEAHAVMVDSLTFCFEMLTNADPVLNGAQLKLETVPHRARCQQCNDEFVIRNFVAQCPRCQTWSNEIVSGLEFQVFAMEFEPDLVQTGRREEE
jgi:hydrogenase nickel incorporation protein HypA/HybF